MTLTDSETVIVVLLARGLTMGEIAKRQRLSINTVKRHVERIQKRWDMPSAAGVVGEAYRTGAIRAQIDLTPPDPCACRLAPFERTVEEWVNHPDALNDLINAMGGVRRRHRRAA